MSQHIITVDEHIKSINTMLCQRCSHRLASRKDRWQRAILTACADQGLDVPHLQDALVEIIVSSYRARQLDKDNAWLDIKAVIDAIKVGRLDIIADDDPKTIIGPFFQQFVVKKDRRRTDIQLIVHKEHR